MKQVCHAKNVGSLGVDTNPLVARGLKTLIIFIAAIQKTEWYIW